MEHDQAEEGTERRRPREDLYPGHQGDHHCRAAGRRIGYGQPPAPDGRTRRQDGERAQANIDRAIARGTGELDGVQYEELVYEGYGPSGVALLVEAVTDNKNRTTSEMRHAFTKNGGNMGESGCVAWMFDQKGTIVVDKDGVDEDEVMMVALDAGAEDIQDEGDTLDVLTAVADFEAVRVQLEESGFAPLRAEIGRIPQSTVAVAGKEAEQLLRLMEVLEDLDDVQHVYANFDMDDKVLEEMNG